MIPNHSHKLGSERLKGFSDALLSIIATLLVVPLVKLDEEARKQVQGLLSTMTLYEVLTSPYMVESFAMYFVTFSIVFLVWIWHGRQLAGVHMVDTVMVLFNWLSLFFVSMLPFTSGTASHASKLKSKKGTASYTNLQMPFYLNLFALFLCNAVFEVILSFHRVNKTYSRMLIFESMVYVAIALVSVVILAVDLHYAFVPFLFIPFVAGLVQKRMERIRQSQATPETSDEGADTASRTSGLNQSAEQEIQFTASPNGVDKTRLEVFVDGVLAISSTLLILELQPPPACNAIKRFDDCLDHYLDGCEWSDGKCVLQDQKLSKEDSHKMLAYFFSFVFIGIMWTQHHFIFDQFVGNRVNTIMLTLNAHFCMFVSLLPMSFWLVMDFAISPLDKEDKYTSPSSLLGHKNWPFQPDKHAGASACVFAGIIMFLATATLLVMLGYALQHTENYEARRQVSISMFVQYGIAPGICLLNIIVVSLSPSVSYYPVLFIPGLLFLLHFYDYAVHYWKHRRGIRDQLAPLMGLGNEARDCPSYSSIADHSST